MSRLGRLVIYHANCVDGFTAAWAAWRRFGGVGTLYVPAKYGDPPVDVSGRELLIVDFSYPRETLLKLAAEAASIRVFDHHKTAAADLEDLEFAEFDMDRSGAGLAWDILHRGTARPWLINYVEDRDLWRFKLPRSKEINAWIGTAPRESFRQWSELEAAGDGIAAEKGNTVLAVHDRYVRDTAAEARTVTFAGFSVPLVNAAYFNTSELLHHLAENAPFAVAWRQRRDGRFEYSLRSREGAGEDVSAIAKRFPGGGGHRHAAGFTVDRPLNDLFPYPGVGLSPPEHT